MSDLGHRFMAALAPLAVAQMALPAPAQASVIMVASCAGGMVPLRVPGKQGENNSLPCCKVCHISMRKRLAADNCCGEEDDGDVV